MTDGPAPAHASCMTKPGLEEIFRRLISEELDRRNLVSRDEVADCLVEALEAALSVEADLDTEAESETSETPSAPPVRLTLVGTEPAPEEEMATTRKPRRKKTDPKPTQEEIRAARAEYQRRYRAKKKEQEDAQKVEQTSGSSDAPAEPVKAQINVPAIHQSPVEISLDPLDPAEDVLDPVTDPGPVETTEDSVDEGHMVSWLKDKLC